MFKTYLVVKMLTIMNLLTCLKKLSTVKWSTFGHVTFPQKLRSAICSFFFCYVLKICHAQRRIELLEECQDSETDLESSDKETVFKAESNDKVHAWTKCYLL